MKTNNNLAPIITVQPNHIRMISERLCDTEDWSNDAGNSAFTEIHYIFKYIQTEKLFHHMNVFTVFLIK